MLNSAGKLRFWARRPSPLSQGKPALLVGQGLLAAPSTAGPRCIGQGDLPSRCRSRNQGRARTRRKGPHHRQAIQVGHRRRVTPVNTRPSFQETRFTPHAALGSASATRRRKSSRLRARRSMLCHHKRGPPSRTKPEHGLQLGTLVVLARGLSGNSCRPRLAQVAAPGIPDQ